MTDVYDHYSHELAQAHREALAALRELLTAETDPTERRRLAIAILRARPIKAPQAPAAERPDAAAHPSTVNATAAHRQPAPTPSATHPEPPTDHPRLRGRDKPGQPADAGAPHQTHKPRRESPGGGSSAAA